MRNLSNFLQNCCHSLGEQLMSMTGRSRRGWRPVGAGAAAGSATGRGTWFAKACVIMEPIAPSPAGQEKSQPSYSHVTLAMVKQTPKSTKFTSYDGHRGAGRRRRRAAMAQAPGRAAGRRRRAKMKMMRRKGRGRPPTSPGSRRPLAGDEGDERS